LASRGPLLGAAPGPSADSEGRGWGGVGQQMGSNRCP